MRELSGSGSGNEHEVTTYYVIEGEKPEFPSVQIPDTIMNNTGVLNSGVVTPDKLSNDSRDIETPDRRLNMKLHLAVVWNNKGVILCKSGKYTEAIEAFNQALMIDPNYSHAWNNKGIAFRKLGNYIDAIKAYYQALMIDSDNPAMNDNQVLSSCFI
jgi:tetratricopeptide (TPR) repeat protein